MKITTYCLIVIFSVIVIYIAVLDQRLDLHRKVIEEQTKVLINIKGQLNKLKAVNLIRR